MSFVDLLESFREELVHFNAQAYPFSFKRFEDSASPFFESLSNPAMEACALIDEMERRCNSLSRKEKREALYQDKMVLTLYVAPASERRKGAALSFAEELCRQWNARFPKNTFKLGRYEDIMHGFEGSIFGLPLSLFHR